MVLTCLPHFKVGLRKTESIILFPNKPMIPTNVRLMPSTAKYMVSSKYFSPDETATLYVSFIKIRLGNFEISDSSRPDLYRLEGSTSSARARALSRPHPPFPEIGGGGSS